MDCLRAIAVRSPAVQARYDNTVRVAMGDPAAQFTAEQRALLAEFVGSDGPDTRSIVQPVRLSPAERHELEDAAQAAGMSLSEYIRSRLFSS
jgi:hypothetical protein